MLPLLSLWLPGCATSEKKPAGNDEVSSAGGKEKSEGPAEASASRVTLTNSLSNNPLTSATIASGKAEQEAERYRSGNAKDKRTVEGQVSAERLARKGLGDVLGSAKRLAEIEMEKGASNTISSEVKLELALAAMQAKNFAFAEYLLQELVESKNAKVKAGAYNAMGVIALHDDRVPEAVYDFKEALKAVSNYKPALLNLGFAALKGGDLSTTKQALSGLQNDWFVQYALISVARLEGNDSHAAELCDRVLKKEPAHIAALFNCALFEYQNRHNVAKAKEYLNRASRSKGGETGWSERSFMLISQIDQEEAQVKRDAAHNAAVKTAADKSAADKAAAEKAKAQKPAAKPAGPGNATQAAPAGAGSPPAGAAPPSANQ